MTERVQATGRVEFGEPLIFEPQAAGAPPEIDVERLSPPQRAQYQHLLSMRQEADSWITLFHRSAAETTAHGDFVLERGGDQIKAQIDEAIRALGRGADITDAEIAITRSLIELHRTFPVAEASAVNSSSFPADVAELYQVVTTNRGQLAEYYAAAMAENRPDVARRVAVMIRQLDEAAETIAADPTHAPGVEAARRLANQVNEQFGGVQAIFDAEPAPAEVQALRGQAPAQPLQPAATDGVDTAHRPGPAVTGSTGNAEFDRRLQELETQAAAQNDRLEAQEAAEAEAMRKPGFGTALLEGLEFAARFFLPIANLVSAIVNGLRLLWMIIVTIGEFIAGKEEKTYDWKDYANVLVRLGGDIAGVFIPPAGAITDQAADFLFNESRFMGFDFGKENLLRTGLSEGANWVGSRWNDVTNAFTGVRTPSEGAEPHAPMMLEEAESVPMS